MHVNEFGVKEKTNGIDQWPIICISNMLNKFLGFSTNKPLFN
jgi:hypothetical protein